MEKEKKNFTEQEIRGAWTKYQEDEMTEKELVPFYKSMLEQKMWSLFSELVADSYMPSSVQAWFVKLSDADKIMHRYIMYSGCEGKEIYEGNGAVFLRNKHIEPQMVHEFINRFYLKESDQLAFFDITASRAKLYIGDFLRHYQKQWGLIGEAWNRAEREGYCK